MTKTKKIKALIKAYEWTIFFNTSEAIQNEKDKTPEDYKTEGKIEAYKEIIESLNKIVSKDRRKNNENKR